MIQYVLRPLFRKLNDAPVEHCLHRQRRRDRVHLFCVKPLGHAGYHLHDVHPGGTYRDLDKHIFLYGKERHE